MFAQSGSGNAWERLGTPGNAWERLGTGFRNDISGFRNDISGFRNVYLELYEEIVELQAYPGIPGYTLVYQGMPGAPQSLHKAPNKHSGTQKYRSGTQKYRSGTPFPGVPRRSQAFPGVPRRSQSHSVQTWISMFAQSGSRWGFLEDFNAIDSSKSSK